MRRPRSAGQRLDPRLASELGSALDADLTQVRIHTGPDAEDAAQRLAAHAFTIGQDVYFNGGEYAPNSAVGRELLTHELAHTVGATGAAAAGTEPYLTVDRPDSAAEREARSAARSTAHGSRRHAEPAWSAAVMPRVQRQPKAAAPVTGPTVVLFQAAATDVAGARSTAERLARLIRSGAATEDDLEVLRQAGSYFTGRALVAFHEVIRAGLADRDVLQEVSRQAPPQPPGTTYVVPLLVTPMNARSVADATRTGKRHAAALRSGTVSSELRDEIEAHIRYFEGEARTAYRSQLTQSIEDVKSRTEHHEPGERTYLGHRRDPSLGPGFGPTARVDEFQTDILPVSSPRKTLSVTLALIAAVRNQTSDSVSVEYYTDYSAGAEIGVKIPVHKVVEIKLGGGFKTGRKSADKHEEAKVKVSERRISRNYQVDILAREVLRKEFRQVQEESRPVGGGFVIEDVLETTLQSAEHQSQTGYRLASKEDAQSREVWPVIVGRHESQTAAKRLVHLLDVDGERMAEELARLVEAGL